MKKSFLFVTFIVDCIVPGCKLKTPKSDMTQNKATSLDPTGSETENPYSEMISLVAQETTIAGMLTAELELLHAGETPGESRDSQPAFALENDADVLWKHVSGRDNRTPQEKIDQLIAEKLAAERRLLSYPALKKEVADFLEERKKIERLWWSNFNSCLKYTFRTSSLSLEELIEYRNLLREQDRLSKELKEFNRTLVDRIQKVAPDAFIAKKHSWSPNTDRNGSLIKVTYEIAKSSLLKLEVLVEIVENDLPTMTGLDSTAGQTFSEIFSSGCIWYRSAGGNNAWDVINKNPIWLEPVIWSPAKCYWVY